MPTAWTRLIDLKPSTFRAHVKLRLIRCYDLISYRNDEVYARECIFHDEEGNRVLASFPKEDFPLFNPALKEGKLMRVRNPVVQLNKKPKLAAYRFQLCFAKKTVVSETHDDKFPDYVFNFKPFEWINEIKDFENTPMFDVIGALILDQPAYTKPIRGKDTLLLDVFLQDLEGTQVACTLWAKYASQLIKFLEKGSRQAVVLLIQMCRAGKFNGIIKASTFFNISKVYINENIPEIQTFRDSISTLTTETTTSTIKLRTIEEVIQRKEPGRFWISASIAWIENPTSWTYTSCKGCPRKKCPSESAIPCTVCKAEGVVLRYRLKVQVVDDTGNLTLVLWDKHYLRILGKRAEELVKKTENLGDLPFEIEDLIEKNMMFEVEVSKSNASLYEDTFSVSQVSTDPKFIEKHSIETPDTQESVSLMKTKYVLVDEAGCSSSAHQKEEDNISMPIQDEDQKVEIKEKNCLKRDLLEDFESVEEVQVKKGKKAVLYDQN